MIESEVLKDFQKLSLIIEEKQKKIVDLEAKLEKKEFAINNYWKSEKNKKEMFREENKKLKQQLAEKDKESLKYFKEYRAWKEKCELLEQDQNQTAIAELEKVKEQLEPKYFDYEQINYLTNTIDQQISNLKGGE